MAAVTPEDRQREIWQGLHNGTPRALRAHRFANQIAHLMRDYVPQSREIQRRLNEHLLMIGYEGNLELLNVPPECDAFDKIALEKKMYDAAFVRAGGLDDALKLQTNP